jgi:hypothetical protein
MKHGAKNCGKTETRQGSLENLSDAEINNDFQLPANQRNAQKRKSAGTAIKPTSGI